MITALDLKNLRDRTGCGIFQCQKALEACDGNADLAFYYLKYDGCAVLVKGITYKEWVMQSALKDYNESLDK